MNNTNQVVTIGCDPEFVPSKNGDLYPIKNITNFKVGESGFGADGTGYAGQGEIRPGYSTSLIKLVGKIEKVLQQGEQKFQISKKCDKLLAGHYKYGLPLGGHIHISNKALTAKRNECGILLDYFIDECLEFLLANKKERELRKEARHSGHPYGVRFSEDPYAFKDHKRGRLEYRTPGSWLLNPRLTLAYLFVAKACTTLALKQMTLPQFRFELLGRSHALRVERLKELISVVGKHTKDTDMVVGGEILLEMVRPSQVIKWDEDLRIGWGLDITKRDKKEKIKKSSEGRSNEDLVREELTRRGLMNYATPSRPSSLGQPSPIGRSIAGRARYATTITEQSQAAWRQFHPESIITTPDIEDGDDE